MGTEDNKPQGAVPRHIAIVMDGNGRWAKKRLMPRLVGHKKGVETVRKVIKACNRIGVESLTLFAFSSENWKRPKEEVSGLMSLFMLAMEKEVDGLIRNNVRLSFIGDRSQFSEDLQAKITESEQATAHLTGVKLQIAANYGGRWDIVQAAKQLSTAINQGGLSEEDWTEEQLNKFISTNYLPEPDLFIRTGGETRISNFLLWQLAYTELYFTDVLWPDFDEEHLQLAIQSFSLRQRRFGMTGEQVATPSDKDGDKHA
jgi:undecaprenyl diphosphate synthase